MSKLKTRQIELAWLAGLLEGEGSFTWRKSGPKISMQMNDKDVILRAQRVARCGRVYPVRTRGRWSLNVQRSAEAAELMRDLLPYMGERRSLAIKRCLLQWDAIPKNMCRSGRHKMEGNNVIITNRGRSRRCRMCQSERQADYYKDRRAK